MQKLPLLAGVIAGSLFASQAQADDTQWEVYSSIDLFGYSEPVSIDQFAQDFDDDLEDGETAFVHGRIEAGGKWRGFRIGYVHRFDYVTEFTEDTAFYHHATENGLPVPTDRNYDLLLDVERLEAKGFEIGYEWQFRDDMTLDVSYSYYSDISQLQSGFAAADGDLEPFDDAFDAELQAALDNIDLANPDVSELRQLAQRVQANVAIDYAYDEPKFGEPDYREPVITGDPNPVITGVDLSEPDGTGYSVDIGFNWQVNDQLNVNVELIDIVNEFNWDNAPTTRATFNTQTFLQDALGVVEQLLLGEIVTPNDLIDRNVNVVIQNEDYDQELDERYDIEVSYDLGYQLDLFGWQPTLGVTGGWFYTANQNFPRVGVNLNRQLFIGYDIGGEALSISYEGKYGFIRFITDDLSYDDANTYGIAAGINYNF
jgi:hypothetical protein